MANNISKHSFLQNQILKDVAWIVIIAVAYFVVGRLSLRLIFAEGIASIWPASGIFLSAVLLCRNKFGFILLSVLFSHAIAATVASFASWFFLLVPFWQSWIVWWSSDAVGNLLIIPLILAWATWSWKMTFNLSMKQVLEIAVFAENPKKSWKS